MAAPDITKAWSAFFKAVAVCDPAELKKQGWMTNEDIAAMAKINKSAGLQLADEAFKKGKLEKRAFKVLKGGYRRMINFYRPK